MSEDCVDHDLAGDVGTGRRDDEVLADLRQGRLDHAVEGCRAVDQLSRLGLLGWRRDGW